ncbi:prepilin-type N-terminal cleavage/methylation domain-containing protein [Candidatus Peribacteria bacterium]|nr:prepilin-type N-terminal cleavage/methylation domain-containing protein [Candidatus Peribacteria bacterium]
MRRAGFTLLELVIAMALSAVVLTAAVGGYGTLRRVEATADIHRNLQQESIFVMQRLTDLLRESAVVTSTGSDLIMGEQTLHYDAEAKTLTFAGQPLTSEEIQVGDFSAILTAEEGMQPRTVLTLTLQHRTVAEASLTLRTVISSRVYQF